MNETYIDKVVNLVKKETGLKGNQLIRYYALLVLAKGENITLQDIHNGWSMDMNFKEKNKYCYGHDHFSIVPFDKLSKDIKAKDGRYLEGLKRVAEEVKEWKF